LSSLQKHWLKLILFGLVATLGLVWIFGQISTRPTPSRVDSLAKDEQEIMLQSADGLRISASYFPVAEPSAPTILMLHGNGGSRSQFSGYIAWLNSNGYAAMAIDFRGHGESQAASKSFGFEESRDAAAAFNWIKTRKPESKIGVIGFSLGGAATLLPANGPLKIDALVLSAVYPDIERAIRNRIAHQGHPLLAALLTPLLTNQSYFRYRIAPQRISPIEAAAQYKGPVLVIGGGQDHYTPPAETKALYERFTGPKSLWIRDGFGHNQLGDINDENYRARLKIFFDKNLK
jgi:uncharacterized protein